MFIRDRLELGHDAQDHIGYVEGNVGDQNRLKSQGDAEGDERQHQGDARATTFKLSNNTTYSPANFHQKYEPPGREYPQPGKHLSTK